MSHPPTWPTWQPEIVSIEGPERVVAGDSVQGEAVMLGFAVTGRSVIVSASDDHLEEDVIVGVRMRITYELTETPHGSRVGRKLQAELPSGPAGRILSFFLARRLRKMQDDVLDELVAQAEASASG